MRAFFLALVLTLVTLAGAWAQSSPPPAIPRALLGQIGGVQPLTTQSLLRRLATQARYNNPRVNAPMDAPPVVTAPSYCASSTAYNIGDIVYQSPSFYTVTTAGTTSSYPCSSTLVGNGSSISFGGAVFAYASSFPTAQYSGAPSDVGSVTGSISGTTLTVTAQASGSIGLGTVLSTGSVLGGTTVLPYGTNGTTGTGGLGTYAVSFTQTMASQSITTNLAGNFYGWNGGSDARRNTPAYYGGIPTTDSGSTGYEHALAATVAGTKVPFSQRVEFICDCTRFLMRRFDSGPTINMTGSISGNVLTVTAISGGSLSISSSIIGPGIPAGTEIIKPGTGTGGTGTYLLPPGVNLSISSETMAAGGGNYRVIVNGRYASLTPVQPTHSAFGYLMVDFSAVGGRAQRDITIEMNGQSFWGGIDVASNEAIYSPPPVAQLTMAVTGDSQASCGDCQNSANSYPSVMADLLGIKNVDNAAIGGCGLSVISSCASGPAISRLSDVTAFNPSIVLEENGGNDCGGSGANVQTPSQIQSETLALLQAIRVSLPNALILVSGIHPVRLFGSTNTASVCEGAVAAAVTQFADANTIWLPDATLSSPFFTGTAYYGYPNGTGNLDFYSSPSGDGHLTEAGWNALGQRQADQLIQALGAIY